MLKLLLFVFTVINLIHSGVASIDVSKEEVDFFKKDCFPSDTRFDEEKCFETIDVSLLTNKSLLKGMALAVNTRELPLAKAVERALTLNEAGQSAFLVYYLKQKGMLKSFLDGKVYLNRSELRKLKVYDYLRTWKTAIEELKNEARFHKLTSTLFTDHHSSLEVLRSPPEQQALPQPLKATRKMICYYLKNNEWTQKCFNHELPQSHPVALGKVLTELQQICQLLHHKPLSEGESLGSRWKEINVRAGFMKTVIQRKFDSLQEIEKFVMAKSSSPIYTLAFQHELDSRHHFSKFEGMHCVNEMISAIVQIKGKYGPHYSNFINLNTKNEINYESLIGDWEDAVTSTPLKNWQMGILE